MLTVVGIYIRALVCVMLTRQISFNWFYVLFPRGHRSVYVQGLRPSSSGPNPQINKSSSAPTKTTTPLRPRLQFSETSNSSAKTATPTESVVVTESTVDATGTYIGWIRRFFRRTITVDRVHPSGPKSHATKTEDDIEAAQWKITYAAVRLKTGEKIPLDNLII